MALTPWIAAPRGTSRTAPLSQLHQPGPRRRHRPVNTSGEDQKGGVDAGVALEEVCAAVRGHDKFLALRGLMTIGRAGTPAADFASLVAARDALEDGAGLQLSMGMSADFEMAVADFGSDVVRVGSTIFGARPPMPAK